MGQLIVNKLSEVLLYNNKSKKVSKTFLLLLTQPHWLMKAKITRYVNFAKLGLPTQTCRYIEIFCSINKPKMHSNKLVCVLEYVLW